MFNPFAEHAGVNIRIQRHERFAEERRECRYRLGDALFGAGDLGCKARDEVVHGGFLAQPGNGWQDAEAVCREEDDHRRDAADTGDGRIGNISMG